MANIKYFYYFKQLIIMAAYIYIYIYIYIISKCKHNFWYTWNTKSVSYIKHRLLEGLIFSKGYWGCFYVLEITCLAMKPCNTNPWWLSIGVTNDYRFRIAVKSKKCSFYYSRMVAITKHIFRHVYLYTHAHIRMYPCVHTII